MFSLTPGGVTSRDYQGTATLLVNKEYDQISAGVSLSYRSVQIFVGNITSLGELKDRTIQKQLLNFVLGHMMLALDLVRELPQPNDFFDYHSSSVSPRHTNYRNAKRKVHPSQPPTLGAEDAAE